MADQGKRAIKLRNTISDIARDIRRRRRFRLSLTMPRQVDGPNAVALHQGGCVGNPPHPVGTKAVNEKNRRPLTTNAMQLGWHWLADLAQRDANLDDLALRHLDAR